MGFVFLLILAIIGVGFFWSSHKEKQRRVAQQAEELDMVRRTAEEDVTQFGELVADLDIVTAGVQLDEGGRQDYKRALEAYDTAKNTLEAVQRPEDIAHVTQALEDGRYAASCVRARVEGRPLPVRRPPCFFNPQHGPSVEDVDWAPAGGRLRPVPVCAADAERLAVGAEPAVRKVPGADGYSRRAYWEAGPAYAQYNRGYFNGYAGSGMLPGVLMGAMLMGGMGHAFGPMGWDQQEMMADGDFGQDITGGADMGGDLGGGDFGGDMDFGDLF
ncbi:hypothetical protein NQ036_12610 [Brevibacterium sp. 91QC2O2]|uniref:hypothetical protein n=1 Tax=Brevibacterium sp. 91QC2O2 TaxID=2968458 RepID=UPI00211D15AA|nr:hypothetical protein [Brevibacterium sp. 91QC2O2]MCQ9369079.1 hypothetical protein [Brevibacterium sp. 91QC2O2]